MAIGSALSVGLIGLKAFIIQIQAFVSPGLPYFSIIGLPDTSLSEARERVKSACQASGAKWPETRVTVNLSPASMPKRGSSHDLAIAASVLSASGMIPHDCLNDTVVLGEVNLDGTVLPINGLLPILLHARDQGVCKVIVPHANLDEAALVPDVDAIGIRHVGELIELMGGTANYTIPDMIRDVDANDGAMSVCPPPGDMNEVMGQETAKWALFRHSKRRTIPHPPHPWSAAARDWLNQARSRGRIGASYSWTRRPNSRHAPCKPCANHWNPGMWRYPARKAPPTIRHDSN